MLGFKKYRSDTVIEIIKKHTGDNPELMWAIMNDFADAPFEGYISARWKIIVDDEWKGGGCAKCSACGYGYALGSHFEPYHWKYCPNCGTRMEGGYDETD